MILGFTGTSRGMTLVQKTMFTNLLARLCPKAFHHGDCIGADAEAHALVREHCPRCIIEIHPPIDPKARAFCQGGTVWPLKPYLERNKAIVFHCDELAAAPLTRVEELRSGTWSTVRYARKALKPIHMVWP